MARIVAVEHLTLDGVYQGPGRADEDTRDGFPYGGWGLAGNDPQMQEVIGKAMGGAWSLLTGRITYEGLYDFWPRQVPNPMTDALNKVEKFVATSASAALPWQHSVRLQGVVGDAIKELKRTHTKTLVIFGSGVLVQSLMELQLIDEYVLMTHPLILGKGRRLFEGQNAYSKLSLRHSVITGTGVIIATYQPVA